MRTSLLRLLTFSGRLGRFVLVVFVACIEFVLTHRSEVMDRGFAVRTVALSVSQFS